MDDIKITYEDGQMLVESPYSEYFIKQAKKLSARWKPVSKVWAFDIRDKDRVNEILKDTYGYDPKSDTGEKFTIRIYVGDKDDPCESDEIRMAGRVLARKPGRDSMPYLSKGVIIYKGGFNQYGGSVRNPRITFTSETYLEVRDLPKSVIDYLDENEWNYELVESVPASRKEELLKRKNELLNELKEIEAELAALDEPIKKEEE